MVRQIKHAKTSGKSDSGDATLVQPTDWNNDHTIVYGPAFYARRITTDQTVTNNTATVVIFNTADYDTGTTLYSTSTGRWTPNVAGIYHVDANVMASTVSGAFQLAYVTLRKSGTDYARGDMQYDSLGTSLAICGLGVSVDVPMNGTTDYLEVVFQHTTVSGTSAANVNSAGIQTHFSGHYVRT